MSSARRHAEDALEWNQPLLSQPVASINGEEGANRDVVPPPSSPSRGRRTPSSRVSASPLPSRYRHQPSPSPSRRPGGGADDADAIQPLQISGSAASPSMSRKPFIGKKNDYLTNKLKYYENLRRHLPEGSPKDSASPTEGDALVSVEGFLQPPAHVLPSYLFVLGTKVGEEQKQNRLQTIASIVNTMMGTTIVALPYGMATTGLALGAVIIGIMGVISCFTCLMIMKYGKGYDEFSDMVAHYLGRYPRYGAWLISVAVIVGAAMVYHILMQESLYQLVGTIITAHSPDAASHWKRVYAAMVPLIVYPVCNMKDMSALVKVNSLGFLFLWYTIMFVLYHGFHAMSHTTFSWVASQDPSASFYAPDGSLRIVYGGQSTFSALGGMMMLSFFIHNAVQAITKNAQPATVRADVVIAYMIAGSLYALVGIVGYFGMADAHTKAECAADGSSDCSLKSNFLTMFGTTFNSGADIYAFTARMSLLFQLITVFPLLLLIIRTQVCGLLFKTAWPGFWKVATLNALVMALTFTLAALDLQISSVLRFTGAIGGISLIFAVPVAIDVLTKRKEGSAWVGTYVLHGIIMAIGILFFILQFVNA